MNILEKWLWAGFGGAMVSAYNPCMVYLVLSVGDLALNPAYGPLPLSYQPAVHKNKPVVL